jgi:hypothetical protein
LCISDIRKEFAFYGSFLEIVELTINMVKSSFARKKFKGKKFSSASPLEGTPTVPGNTSGFVDLRKNGIHCFPLV